MRELLLGEVELALIEFADAIVKGVFSAKPVDNSTAGRRRHQGEQRQQYYDVVFSLQGLSLLMPLLLQVIYLKPDGDSARPLDHIYHGHNVAVLLVLRRLDEDGLIGPLFEQILESSPQRDQVHRPAVQLNLLVKP